jgi:outer membrane lipoprotein SlyB
MYLARKYQEVIEMKISCKILSVLVISSFVLASCAREMSSDVYTSSSTSGKVLEGKVVSARPITIKDSDKLQDNTAGILGGGLLGGVAASSVGKGTGKGVAAIGGALLGAAAGALAQDKLGTSKGMEYIVRIDKKYISSIPTHKTRKNISYGANSVEQDVNQSVSVEETKTDLISVVQAADVVFQPGSRVMVIYNNDRPRLTAAN